MNTKISYLYRDANNSKQGATVILSGDVSKDDLLDCCDDDDCFLPEQVGLHALQCQMCSPVNNEEDHVWHELTDCDPTDEQPNFWMTATELLERFQSARNNWNIEDEMETVGLLEEV